MSKPLTQHDFRRLRHFILWDQLDEQLRDKTNTEKGMRRGNKTLTVGGLFMGGTSRKVQIPTQVVTATCGLLYDSHFNCGLL